MIDGAPYNVEDVDFVKPGKGRAIYRLKLRNLLNGSTADRTYHSGEKVEEVHTPTQEEQYLYKEGEQYVFMNTENFEQHFIAEEQLGNKKNFLKEGMLVVMLMMNDEPIDITLPTSVVLKIVRRGIATKTGTISPQTISATLETGYNIEVPSFVKEGDIIKVDTRSGTYVERVSKK